MSLQVRKDTSLVVVLELFMSRRVSSLPIVDSHGHFINVFSKADVMVIAFRIFHPWVIDAVIFSGHCCQHVDANKILFALPLRNVKIQTFPANLSEIRLMS